LESIVGFCAARKSLAEKKTQVEKVANKNKLSVAMSQWSARFSQKLILKSKLQ
jgi:hypothetical protein